MQAFAEYQHASSNLSEAARLAPENAENHAALAALLATCPDAKLRDVAAAVEYGTLRAKWRSERTQTV